MSLDRQLFEELQSGIETRPAFRLYCWDKPTVSLGTNQVAEEVVNVEKINELGYGLVKRPTGGRALLHKGDICYAVVAHRQSHPAFHSLTSTYRVIGEAISASLQSLGVKISELPSTGSHSHGRLNPCFAMLNPFEVTVGGRKICGNAQFRSGDFFLQHGSIRIIDNWNQADLVELWPSSFQLDSDSITSIEAEVPDLRPIPMVAAHLTQSFGSRLDFDPAGIAQEIAALTAKSQQSH